MSEIQYTTYLQSTNWWAKIDHSSDKDGLSNLEYRPIVMWKINENDEFIPMVFPHHLENMDYEENQNLRLVDARSITGFVRLGRTQ